VCDAAGWARESPGGILGNVLSCLRSSPLVLWLCGLHGLHLVGCLSPCGWTVCADVVQPVKGWVARQPFHVCEPRWWIANGVLWFPVLSGVVLLDAPKSLL
jgi:hypothetical protein